jgi:O-antigen ligase
VARPVPKAEGPYLDAQKSLNDEEIDKFYGLKAFWCGVKSLKWLILVLFLAFIVHFTVQTRLSLYLLLRWLELIVAYGTLVVIFKEFDLKALILKLFACLSGLEALLALTQFAKQSSLGLFKIGEQHISPTILGVAKIVSSGTTYIRGYGTFPHPNPLSAVLVAGIFTTLYLLISSISLKAKITYSFLLFLSILGLTVTFSRGAYLALAAGLIIFFGMYNVIARSASDEAISPNKKIASAALAMTTILVSIIISFAVFRPFLLTRATFSDQSTMARKFYDVTGVKMAIQNPIFGVGLGESMLHMEQYSGKVLAPWDKQPPHNYFIIAAAELGIPAALILLWIFLSQLWMLVKKIRLEKNPEQGTYYLLLTTILISFLLLMQFDHYFYTLEQTQLLLWFVLALNTAEIKNPQIGD